MERPTDAYKETHNITLSQEDTLFGGQVSNLQVFFLYIFTKFAITFQPWAQLLKMFSFRPITYSIVQLIQYSTSPVYVTGIWLKALWMLSCHSIKVVKVIAKLLHALSFKIETFYNFSRIIMRNQSSYRQFRSTVNRYAKIWNNWSIDSKLCLVYLADWDIIESLSILCDFVPLLLGVFFLKDSFFFSFFPNCCLLAKELKRELDMMLWIIGFLFFFSKFICVARECFICWLLS